MRSSATIVAASAMAIKLSVFEADAHHVRLVLVHRQPMTIKLSVFEADAPLSRFPVLEADISSCAFRSARSSRARHHTAPAGPACLNTNAPHRRGRPALSPSAGAHGLSPFARPDGPLSRPSRREANGR